MELTSNNMAQICNNIALINNTAQTLSTLEPMVNRNKAMIKIIKWEEVSPWTKDLEGNKCPK